MKLQISIADFGALVLEKRKALGWTQEGLAAEALGNLDRKGYISQIENGKLPNISALTVQKIAAALGIDRSQVDAMLGVVAPDAAEVRAEIDALRAEKGSLDEALSQVKTLNRGQWIALATQFELDRPYDASDGALVEFLTEKARDYRALRAEVDAIEDGLKRLSNLKSAARAAIDSGDLDEVEEILSRVQEVEKEEAAKTGELRAENALLRNRPDQAAALYADAADSFAILDPLEPARRRLKYGAELYDHGLRYGGTGLSRAADLWRSAADTARLAGDDGLLDAALTNLGAALQIQGSRNTGASGAALMGEAVTAFRAALEVRTRDAHPVDWATTQNNLANTLQEQGNRTSGDPGAALIAEAVTAFRAALEVFTRAAHPVGWATTQNNLANTLQLQGSRTSGAPGAALLGEAVAAYRAALEVRTRAVHPVNWAMTQNNLGLALQEQGRRTSGAPGAALLAEAIATYRAALEVRTHDAHPVDWAQTQTNLANALQDQGSRTSGAPGAALLDEAIATLNAVLEVRTRAAHPVHWAETQENLAINERARADHDTCTDPDPHLQAALAHVTAALEVYDPTHMPYRYDAATTLKQKIETRLAGLSRP